MIIFLSAIGNLTVIPSDTEAKVGQSVRFMCSTSIREKEIHWFHTPVGDRDRDYVYGFSQIYPKYASRFQVEKLYETGASNLLITSVEIGDAGRYFCQDDGGNGNRSSAQLIVLGKLLSA